MFGEKKQPVKTGLTRKREPESGSGKLPLHTRSLRKQSANVGRFVTGDFHAHWIAVDSRTRAGCEPFRAPAPSCAKAPGRFPRQRATPQQPPQHSCLQATPPATAKAPRLAQCASEAHRSPSMNTCARSPRAFLDPNKTPAARAWHAPRRSLHHCPTIGCVGSDAQRSRSADNAAA